MRGCERVHNLLKYCFITVFGISLACTQGVAQTPPSPSDQRGYTGLHRAAWTDDVTAITRAADAGADLEARDANGRTPIHVAAFASNDAALAALAAAGADMNALEGDFYDVVTIASVANDPELLALALDLGNRPDLITSRYEGTALIAAAHLGHFNAVELLVDAGAPLDHVNNLGWTALIEAVILGDGGRDHIETVRILVAAGADVDIADRNGRTPVDHARLLGYREIVTLLKGGG